MGTEFANHCDGWNGSACVNTSPDRALEHWVYLVLPTPLSPGKTYSIDTGTLAGNASKTNGIDDDALRQPFYAAMKGIFLHRSGIDIDPKYGEGFARPAPHNPTLTPGFKGQLKYTKTRYFDVSSSDAADADKAKWEAGIVGDI